jgi:hypothetical protein
MTRARTLRWMSVLAAFALASSPAAAAEWRRLTVTPDRFSIEFSDAVTVQSTVLDAKAQDGVVRSTIYMETNTVSVFAAAATLLKGNANFQGGVDSTMSTYKCEAVDSDVPGTLADGTLTRLIHAHQCAGGVRVFGSFFLHGQWFYQVITMIAADADSSDAEHFLQSFQLLPD